MASSAVIPADIVPAVSLWSYISFTLGDRTLRGSVTEVNKELKLMAVKTDSEKPETHWVAESKLQRAKRKLPRDFDPVNEDTVYYPGDMLSYYDSDTDGIISFTYTDEKEGVINPGKGDIKRTEKRMKVVSRAPKRSLEEARAAVQCPVLDLVMAYVGRLDLQTWVERHTAARWYMRHSKEPTLRYTEENDRLLCEHIKKVLTELLGAKRSLWQFIERYGILTGSSLVALAHSDPTKEPTVSHAGILFQMKHVSKTSSDWPCGDIDLFATGVAGAGDLIRNITGKVGKPYQYKNALIQGDDGSITPYKLYHDNVAGTLGSYKVSMRKCQLNVTSAAVKYGKHTAGGVGEVFHQFISERFDFSLLNISFDGKTLRIGDGSVKARDSLARLTSRYTSATTVDKARAGERYYKYIHRGVRTTGLMVMRIEPAPPTLSPASWRNIWCQLSKGSKLGAFQWNTDQGITLVTKSGVWSLPRRVLGAATPHGLINWSLFNVAVIAEDMRTDPRILRFGSQRELTNCGDQDERLVERCMRVLLPSCDVHYVNGRMKEVIDMMITPTVICADWSVDSHMVVINYANERLREELAHSLH